MNGANPLERTKKMVAVSISKGGNAAKSISQSGDHQYTKRHQTEAPLEGPSHNFRVPGFIP